LALFRTYEYYVTKFDQTEKEVYDDVKIIANRDMQNKIVKGISEGIKMYAERKDN
jgi:hypothetical protein